MAIKLNLLPEELAVKKGLKSVAKVFKTLNVVALVILIVFAVGLLIFFFINSSQLRSLETQIVNLTDQVQSQQSTEQKIVLVKDRLGKIKAISAIESSSEGLEDLAPIIASLPENSTLSEVGVEPKKITTSMSFSSSSSMSDFFTAIYNFDNFSTITLNSFGLNPSSGYTVGLTFIRK